MRKELGQVLLISIIVTTLIIVLLSVFFYFKINKGDSNSQNIYQADTTQAKDIKIKSDFLELQQALEQYKVKNSSYPSELNELVYQSFIMQVPKDPYTNRDYTYLSDGGDYYLSTFLGSGTEYKVSNH